MSPTRIPTAGPGNRFERLKHLTVRLAMLTGLGGLLRGAEPAPSAPPPDIGGGLAEAPCVAADPRPAIFVAGDSTAARYGEGPHQGWGACLAALVDPAKARVENRARGGRSSRTFVTEGHWAGLAAELRPGDVVLIQFGHNDGGALNEEPPGSTRPVRARGSLPGLGDETRDLVNVVTGKPETVRTFGAYLREMIRDARARGAVPVLLSPTARNVWKDGRVERASGGFRAWTRSLAAQEGVAFVDHTRLIADAYQGKGDREVARYFPKDYAHTSPEGAALNAALVVAGLKGLRPPVLGEVWSEAGAAVPPDEWGWLNLPEPADPGLPSLFLLGDSTVRNGRGDGANGEWGWGEPLAGLVDPGRINLVNRAVGGLSSRTYRTQGHLARALALVKAGDRVLLQFGHNDSSPVNDERRARGTLAGTGGETQDIVNRVTGKPETVHTFGWYLREACREIRALGAVPVIASPVPRKIWVEGRLERADATYGGWARRVAEEEGVPFLDLNGRIAEAYERKGREAVEGLFADATTHTNRAGAEVNAREVLRLLKEGGILEGVD